MRLLNNKLMLSWQLTKSIHTVEDYKNLPKDQREWKGLYLVPRGLEFKLYSKEPCEWSKFYSFVKKEYPIQWFFRRWIQSFDNPVYAFLKIRYMKYQDVKYSIKRFFNPYFVRWRNSCKRHEYKDIRSLVVDSNFALILDFWYKEMENINWDSDKEHKKFYKEIEKAVNYIEVKRKEIQHKADAELSKASERKGKNLSYNQRYSKHNALEKKIENEDEKILVWFIKNRAFFWS